MAYYNHIFAIYDNHAYRIFNPKNFEDIIVFSSDSKYPIISYVLFYNFRTHAEDDGYFEEGRFPQAHIGSRMIYNTNDVNIGEIPRSQRYKDLSIRLSYMINID